MANVIVVGGGAAGLAAAYALRRQGVDVTLFESEPRVGGRIAGDEIQGCRIDTGAQMFNATYREAIELCEELAVPLETFDPTIGYFGRDRFHAMKADRSAMGAMKNLAALSRILSFKGLCQAFRFVAYLKSQGKHMSFSDHSRILDLDTEESISDVVKKRGGAGLLEDLLQSNITTLTLGHPEDVGAAFGMALLWLFVFDPSAKLLTPRKGIGSFATALAQACETDIRVSTPVERIVVEEGRVTGVATRHGFVEAAAVVCATTATAALKIAPDLPESTLQVLRTVTYSRGCHVVFGTDTPTLPDGWFGIGFPGRAGLSLANCNEGALKATLSAPPGRYCLSAFLYDAGGQAGDPLALNDQEIEREVIAGLRPYGIRLPDPLLFTRVYRWPEAVCLAPGGMLREVDRMRRREDPDCQGLFLAGEYMRLPSVNGALVSGFDAAEKAIRFLYNVAEETDR